MNDELLACWPLTVTENDPDDAPDGTRTPIAVALHVTTAALVPLSETLLLPCVAPKFVPVICTNVPIGPELGEMAVIVGACAQTSPQLKRHSEKTRKTTRTHLFTRISATSELWGR